jgi:hypothetical protein
MIVYGSPKGVHPEDAVALRYAYLKLKTKHGRLPQDDKWFMKQRRNDKIA